MKKKARNLFFLELRAVLFFLFEGCEQAGSDSAMTLLLLRCDSAFWIDKEQCSILALKDCCRIVIMPVVVNSEQGNH